jgi:hypothetical protein
VLCVEYDKPVSETIGETCLQALPFNENNREGASLYFPMP